MPVAVVQVVDDADVLGIVVLAEVLHYRDHVLGLATPAAVVVERDPKPKAARTFDERPNGSRDAPHALLFGGAVARRQHLPDLWAQVVFLGEPERFVVGPAERGELNPVFTVREDLFLERRDVLLAPVVGNALETKRLDHGRALHWTALLGVERNDAPSHEVLAGERGGARGLLIRDRERCSAGRP